MASTTCPSAQRISGCAGTSGEWGREAPAHVLAPSGPLCRAQLSVLTLLGMVLLTIKAVDMWKWTLSWELGVPMFALYFIFIAEALLLEYIEF